MKRFGYVLLLLVVLFGFGGTALAEGEGDAGTQAGWTSDGGKWFYINADGSPATGWLQDGSKWFYFGSNGEMQSGWQEIAGKWYYFKEDGAMQKGWQSIDGKWYYFQGSGAMQTGWLKLGSWYYLRGSGAMVANEWIKIGSSWYYFDANGAMATGSKVIDGKTYQFNTSGAWIEQSTGAASGSSSGFAALAPTTRMSFVELVGDNGDYNSIKGYPAKGTYKLVVDLHHQVVLAYKKDSKGNYTVPVRYMVTTTGGPKTPTPVGTYSCKDSRRRFSQFSTGEYAQYWVRVVGEIYFHSLLYSKANANNYMESSYRLLGTRGSHGCIRLLVPDARWVYYNIAPGTTVQIRAGSSKDTTTASIKKQLTRASLPKSRPNCNGVGNTDVWSIAALNATYKK